MISSSQAALVASAGLALAAWLYLRRGRPAHRKPRKFLVCEPSLTNLEEQYLQQAYRSTFISGGAGSFKERLEKEFASFCGCTHGVATANGTVAIDLALLAAGLEKGDEVIVPSFTYVASASAIVSAGGTPVFVDCDELGLMDPKAIEHAITSKTKFIMVVHIYGHTPDMDQILAIARRHNIKVMEDAAEAHGAKYKGRTVGSLGDFASFSFYANKLITTGEGGIVVTNDASLAKRMVYLRGHAMSAERRFWHTDIGFNYRLSNLQCAIGVAQLERFDELFHGRARLIAQYHKALDGHCGVRINPTMSFCSPCPWLACVWLPPQHARHRDAICEDLERRGIETRPFFYAVHTMPPYVGYRMVTADGAVRYGSGVPPGSDTSGDAVAAASAGAVGASASPHAAGPTMSELVAARGFNIPTSVGMTRADAAFIAGAVHDVLSRLCA